MRHLWPLLLAVAAVFVWNRSCNQASQEARAPRAGTHVAESVSGNPVRQMEREPRDMMEREAALPQPGGMSSQAVLDGVRRGLQKPGAR